MRLLEGASETHLWIPGDINPAAAGEVEEAIWDRMHFASHLRSERLGEFTIATELHRSESLAIVQLLVLYHLVTARASVALGGAGTRVDRETMTA
jgi:phosphoribulokinase